LAPMTDSDPAHASRGRSPDRLAFIVFLWACQALVHQEFFQHWLRAGDPLGWALTVVALATLLFPRQLWMFAAMLVCSTLHSARGMPSLPNHILVEMLLNMTLLAAIGREAIVRGKRGAQLRRDLTSSLRPVIVATLLTVYWFGFLAKLNNDFFDPSISCAVTMYSELQQGFPVLPTGQGTHRVVIGLALLVELLTPALLTIRRTRSMGVLVGIVFHFILGIAGHRTFSAFAYGVLLLDPMRVAFFSIRDRLLPSGERSQRLHNVARVITAGVIFTLLAMAASSEDWREHPLTDASFVLWGLWSIAMGSWLFRAIRVPQPVQSDAAPLTALGCCGGP
jgi:hypothetical protein